MNYRTVEPEYEYRFTSRDISRKRRRKDKLDRLLLGVSRAAVNMSYLGVGVAAFMLLWMARTT